MVIKSAHATPTHSSFLYYWAGMMKSGVLISSTRWSVEMCVFDRRERQRGVEVRGIVLGLPTSSV